MGNIAGYNNLKKASDSCKPGLNSAINIDMIESPQQFIEGSTSKSRKGTFVGLMDTKRTQPPLPPPQPPPPTTTKMAKVLQSQLPTICLLQIIIETNTN
ncbi:hypothetical protein CHS0354_029132 [Potamilus streckersoni]|uniref:Uncharacterized protein n=1 Tax=Potamilus streckersoni TaxID=2493646 RepID=A0AAE0W328_9BIVA|nr:hypothetical protein CHS0354_029132 [Potamilus streckersoni]